MAQTVAHVSDLSGIFYIQGESGEREILKNGDVINLGDMVIGDASNTTDNFIKFSIEGLDQEVSISSTEQLVFNEEMLAATLEDLEAAAAAGEPVDEALAGRFGARTGDETDVRTDLREHAFGEEEELVTDEGIPVPPVEGASIPTGGGGEEEVFGPTVPMLSISVTDGQEVTNPGGEPVVIPLPVQMENMYAYADKGNIDFSSLQHTGADLYYNPGNGLGITTEGEQGDKEGFHVIDGTEGLVVAMGQDVSSADIDFKHIKEDETITIQAYNDGVPVGDVGTVDPNTNDASVTYTFNPGAEFDHMVISGIDDTTQGKYGFNVQGIVGYYEDQEPGEAYYTYALTVDSQPTTQDGVLSDVILENIPDGAVLYDSDDNLMIPDVDGNYTVDSDSTLTITMVSPIALDYDDLDDIYGSVSDETYGMSVTDVTAQIIPDTLEATRPTLDYDEMLESGAGADVIQAGAGDDSIVYDEEDIVFGGEGNDTLIIHNNTSIDFSSFDTAKLNNIETIDMRGDGENSLTNVSFDDVLNITGGSHTLHILGDSATDRVEFVNENGNDWVKGDTPEIIGDTTFDVYTSTDGSDTVTVYVQNEVLEEIV
jgi:hypothetical protein